MIESIYQWIDRQEWSDEIKQQAKVLHDGRMNQRLNPMTLGQWRRWAQQVGNK